MNKILIGEEGRLDGAEWEMYRTLRSNIEFSGVENRAIAVTSCQPDDGKTTVAYCLACAFAEAGKNTVLIDGDMRKSVLLRRLKIQSELMGLSHFLSGQQGIGEVLYKTNRHGLYLIPSGVFPSNATELLGNDRLQKLIGALKENFDYVILDTPPLGSVIDAAVAAKSCDASILVIAAEETPRKLAQGVAAQLRSANPNLLGVVLNKVNMRSSSYYANKYYGYGK